MLLLAACYYFIVVLAIRFSFVMNHVARRSYNVFGRQYPLFAFDCSLLTALCLLFAFPYLLLVSRFLVLASHCLALALLWISARFSLLSVCCALFTNSWSWHPYRIWMFIPRQSLITIRSTLIAVQLLVAGYSLLAILFSFLFHPYRSLQAARG